MFWWCDPDEALCSGEVRIIDDTRDDVVKVKRVETGDVFEVHPSEVFEIGNR